MRNQLRRRSYADKQFWESVFWTLAFYSVLNLGFVSLAWWLGIWMPAAVLAFVLYAYRRQIGSSLGWCARRSGARQDEAAESKSTPFLGTGSAEPAARTDEG